ncbi:hypothetical protein D9M72_305440 [compost metagenome]
METFRLVSPKKLHFRYSSCGTVEKSKLLIYVLSDMFNRFKLGIPTKLSEFVCELPVKLKSSKNGKAAKEIDGL